MPKPKVMGSRKPVSLTPAIAKAVEDYRFAQRYNTESEAIRRLIELGLEAAKREKPERKR